MTTKFHIVNADVPFLLCLDDMNHMGIILDNVDNKVIHKASGESMPIDIQNGHPFLLWNPFLHCFFTRAELQRLHRRFGHPHADKLYNLLRRARPDEVDHDTRKTLEAIVRHCQACQLYAQKPHRFKFSLRDNDVDFNHSIYVDILYIDGRPMLHVVDEATNYQAARWLRSGTAEALWKALRLAWVDVYVGPPDIIAHDAGKNFMAQAFKNNTDFIHVQTKAVPVEAPQSMTVVERYHAPLRKAYMVIKKEAPELDNDSALQAAVKAVNDTAGPDGLVPTLLVYGALPRLGLRTDPPAPSIFRRAQAVRKAMKEVHDLFATRQVDAALRARNGPRVDDIHAAAIGSKVLVFREHRNRWEGPYTLHGIQGETCIIQLPSGPTPFRTTVVKPFRPALSADNPNDAPDPAPDENDDENLPNDPHNPQAALQPEPLYNDDNPDINALSTTATSQIIVNLPFKSSRKRKINELFKKGVFTIVPHTDTSNYCIYGT